MSKISIARTLDILRGLPCPVIVSSFNSKMPKSLTPFGWESFVADIMAFAQVETECGQNCVWTGHEGAEDADCDSVTGRLTEALFDKMKIVI